MVPPVRREAPPAVDAPPPSAATPSEPRPSTYVSEPPPGYGGIIGAIQDWLARANRDYQGVIIKDLSIPPTNGASNDAIAKKLDETKAEDARAAAAKRAEDDARKIASSEPRPDDQRDTSIDGKAKASVKEEAAHKARAAKQAADAAKTADAARKLADQREAAEAERAAEIQRLAETKRLADAQRAAEAQIADERRKTLERRKAEDQRRADAASAAPEVVPTKPLGDTRRTVIITTEPIPQDRAARALERRPSRDGVRDDADRDDSGWRSQARAAKGERRMAAVVRATQENWRTRRGPAVQTWSRRLATHRSRAASCHAAGRKVHPPARYVVRRGDSLWRISKRHYRSGVYYARISKANRRTIRDPDRIYPCQRVMVPKKSRR